MAQTSHFHIYAWAKWLISILAISFLVGTTSAFFLQALHIVTDLRENHLWLLIFLPFAGVMVVWCYNRFGGRAQKGNNLLLEEYYHPTIGIPWPMTPLIIITTLITHLFGGSAGREGTAVQYGGSIADQCSRFFRWTKAERRVLLLCGIAAGFSSLFGTPLAGALFALEVVQIGKLRWRAALPVLCTALLSNTVCGVYGDLHTHYPALALLPALHFSFFSAIVIAGLAFGVAAQLFSRMGEWFAHLFSYVKQPLVRPLIGGTLIIIAVYALQSSKYIGLGIPTILLAFQEPLPSSDFLIKTVLTCITLSAGFKGGEVTPLFFIGATLGNALAPILPIPLSILAAMGFVSVFAGCTKTPLACTVMAMELFGWDYSFIFLAVCLISYVVSGKTGIYSAQRKKGSLTTMRWL
ncbi:chloride channel protein [Sphingobacterium oryzagri]|uniref:Chloride channel protein n=1 Tax=Sphingobacterium oryzagri TaxID=3025669 RepID=A0ABY7WNF1_9SPHI|nr:chloride channel protein [Sphingobacterium sp. KACC 22765]WDF70227.1 chloride channel protein [Sphingobacterium sp. KACC 22765]